MSAAKRKRDLHPVLRAAARGDLPDWAVARKRRRRHMERVADLMNGWGKELGLSKYERARWRAAAHLHDALKDAPIRRLRAELPKGFGGYPDEVLHGPAVAARLEQEGVDDDELLAAISYHTVGHPDLGPVGLALYAADYLEPGRRSRRRWRAGLRERMPEEMDDVVLDIVRERTISLVKRHRAIRPETMRFWNELVAARE